MAFGGLDRAPHLLVAIWQHLDGRQKRDCDLLYIAGDAYRSSRVILAGPRSWLAPDNGMALQLLLGAATTQEWLGYSLFEVTSKPACPFCWDIDGWAANPWVHLLAHCHRVGTAIDCTHHHATHRVIRVFGLAGTLYAFSGKVA